MKNAKKKVILSSVLTIALCMSLIAGATFALFTSEKTMNIAVNAGEVKIDAFMTDLETYSFDVRQPDGKFELGGSAALVDPDGINTFVQTLDLKKMVPGDAAKVRIQIDNYSNVVIKYKVRMLAEGDLAPALNAVATIEGVDYVMENNNNEYTSPWTTVELDANGQGLDINDIAVTVAFPNSMDHEEQNKYQNTDAKFTFQVIAVQGNGAEIYDGDVIVMSQASDLDYLAEQLDKACTENANDEEKGLAVVDLGAYLNVPGETVISADMLPANTAGNVGALTPKIYINGDGHKVVAETLVELGDDNTCKYLCISDLEADLTGPAVAVTDNNNTIWMGNCDFTLANGQVLVAGNMGGVQVLLFGTITVNGVELTNADYATYFPGCSVSYFPGYELTPEFVKDSN